MAVSSRAIVDLVLFGPSHDRRQLQDSPILGDVWAAFAAKPQDCVDLLISPYKTEPAGPVARIIAERVANLGMEHPPRKKPNIAYLQGIIAARLYFAEVLRVLVPMTYWWTHRNVAQDLRKFVRANRFAEVVQKIADWAQEEDIDQQEAIALEFGLYGTLERYIALVALILSAEEEADNKGIGGLLARGIDAAEVVKPLKNHLKDLLSERPSERPLIWQVWANRKALPALEKSVPAVKADAARELFKVKCNEITWAVIDSGIDASHPVFLDAEGKTTRVQRTFDFTNIREIVSVDNINADAARARDLLKLPSKRARGSQQRAEEAAANLRRLAEDVNEDRPINWSLVTDFIELRDNVLPESGHGTHVAGIIGARTDGKANSSYRDGLCPDINLYDFRVLGRTLDDTEFAVIAALQYVRYLNDRNTFISVHGVNLSLSIPHDVRNFACGRTPICNECERLIESGVVVVAAAGNLGYHRFETQEGSYEGYAAFSITDPGNADSVITVGATHRFWPHTYGVSFFSSRGPTGDGRPKPDLVAPGERIQSCLPVKGWGELDGTSMAAPHVSGAAAMLMGRYSELIGQPRRIKRILCETATDLGRERSFQGNGMLDVLRAFQKT